MTLPRGPGPTVARSAAGMGLAAAVSRAFGAIRVLAIAAILGTTYLGNAFQSSNTVSNVLFELLAAGALSAVLVPTFVGLLDTENREGAETLASELLGLATLILGAVAVVGVVASPWLAKGLTSAIDDPAVSASQRDLTTFLLWFFIPQVVLYGLGAIATAILNAQRSFVVPAMAPIGNTIVMVGFLVAFRYMAGSDPGLDLSLGERLMLAGGGTLGVVAFVAIPTIAVLKNGFRLRLRFTRTHEGLRRLLVLSGWASLQHGFAALLLGAAIVAGGGVEGGVVAYQVGWYFFLAPYGIIAQPIHTTILPELVADNLAGDVEAFKASVRWSLDSMCALLLPLSALCAALSVPAMSILAFGSADVSRGVEMLAVSLASLGLGLLPYGAFFLLARVFYVYNDSRTPAMAGAAAAVVGVGIMALAAVFAEGTNLVMMLGLAHSAAFVVGSLVLTVALRRKVGSWVLPSMLGRALGCSAVAGVVGWVVYEQWQPDHKLSQTVALVTLSALVLAVYVGLIRLMGVSVTKRIPRGNVARDALT